MPINPANMDECDPKCRCPGGVNANIAFSCDDPCDGGNLGVWNSGTCDCEPDGECYGGIAVYTPCGGASTCFRNTGLRCEEALGGCPVVVSTTDTSIYGCEPDDPDNFSLQIFWQYPDGSLATTTIASGANAQIEANASITALYGTECFSGPC